MVWGIATGNATSITRSIIGHCPIGIIGIATGIAPTLLSSLPRLFDTGRFLRDILLMLRPTMQAIGVAVLVQKAQGFQCLDKDARFASPTGHNLDIIHLESNQATIHAVLSGPNPKALKADNAFCACLAHELNGLGVAEESNGKAYVCVHSLTSSRSHSLATVCDAAVNSMPGPPQKRPCRGRRRTCVKLPR